MAKNSVAKKIQQARKEFGLTQADLAYRMGISAQLISAFENGRIAPERRYLEKIAQFTHKPLYFFTGQKIAEALDRLEKMSREIEEIKAILEKITEAEDAA